MVSFLCSCLLVCIYTGLTPHLRVFCFFFEEAHNLRELVIDISILFRKWRGSQSRVKILSIFYSICSILKVSVYKCSINVSNFRNVYIYIIYLVKKNIVIDISILFRKLRGSQPIKRTLCQLQHSSISPDILPFFLPNQHLGNQ